VVDITGTIAVLSSLLGIPLIVFGFIYMNGRGKREIELSRLRNEAARLELEKERVHLLLLQAENAKYDRLIEERGPFEIHGDTDLLRPLDALLGAFARQRRMKLAGDYKPCYRVVT